MRGERDERSGMRKMGKATLENGGEGEGNEKKGMGRRVSAEREKDGWMKQSVKGCGYKRERRIKLARGEELRWVTFRSRLYCYRQRLNA